MAHPDVAQAAVIGVKHPKWDERPLVIAVRKPGSKMVTSAMRGKFREDPNTRHEFLDLIRPQR